MQGKRSSKKKNKQTNYAQTRRESRNNRMESLDLKPQARDQCQTM